MHCSTITTSTIGFIARQRSTWLITHHDCEARLIVVSFSGVRKVCCFIGGILIPCCGGSGRSRGSLFVTAYIIERYSVLPVVSSSMPTSSSQVSHNKLRWCPANQRCDFRPAMLVTPNHLSSTPFTPLPIPPHLLLSCLARRTPHRSKR